MISLVVFLKESTDSILTTLVIASCYTTFQLDRYVRIAASACMAAQASGDIPTRTHHQRHRDRDRAKDSLDSLLAVRFSLGRGSRDDVWTRSRWVWIHRKAASISPLLHAIIVSLGARCHHYFRSHPALPHEHCDEVRDQQNLQNNWISTTIITSTSPASALK